MKKVVSTLFALLLTVWIVHYWHPINGTPSWKEEVYVTKKKPRAFIAYSKHFPVWIVELDDGNTLYLSMEWTRIQKEKHDK